MPPTKTLLMCCGSLGLGNSARLLGIAQALRRLGASRERLRITAAVAGPGALFWEENGPAAQVEVARLESFRFRGPAGESSRLRWSRLLTRPDNAAVYARNSGALLSWLRRNAADLALIDSDYHFLPVLASRTPVVALGQAWDVLRRGRGIDGPGLPAASLLVERLDYFYQRAVSRRILAPCFKTAGPAPAPLAAIPLIVREEFERPPAAAGPAPGRLCVMTGGSGIAAGPLRDYADRHALPIIGSFGRPSPTLDPAGRPLIDRAAAVVIQGGLSSISECAARRKRMIVVPIEGHAEQLANAVEVERRGLGLRVTELTEPPAALLARLERQLPPAREARWPQVDGAARAAEVLLAELDLADAPSYGG